MAGRIIKIVLLVFVTIWLTTKIVLFSPFLAILLNGLVIWTMVDEIKELKEDANKAKKRPQGHKKVTKS